MIIAGRYSFNGGVQAISERHPDLLEEIEDVIQCVNAEEYKVKKSKEKTMLGRLLYSPTMLNKALRKEFYERSWETVRVPCEYSVEFYTDGYTPPSLGRGAYREMDYMKRGVGIEVQFGKYSFMVYNVCAKMTIFKNLDHIEMGVEVVPMRNLTREMSSGVSYFEQFVWDLEHRGVSDIDIPVLVLGIDVKGYPGEEQTQLR